jgi:hypothetical protein
MFRFTGAIPMAASTVLLITLLASSALQAHVALVDPVPRTPDNDLTQDPCGGIPAGASVATYAAGSDIEIKIDLAVAHGQYLRTAVSYDNFATRTELVMIRAPRSGIYTMTVPLPMQPLGPAVLQVTHQNYVSCADITLAEGELFAIDAGLNGNWWNGPERNGEGVQLEVSDGGDGSLILVATIYSYDTMGNQIFLIAVGTVNGDSADVDVFITQGGRWGDNYDPSLVTESRWGSGRFTADNCDAMHMALMPNAEFQQVGYTNLSYDLVRLTTPSIPCPDIQLRLAD